MKQTSTCVCGGWGVCVCVCVCVALWRSSNMESLVPLFSPNWSADGTDKWWIGLTCYTPHTLKHTHTHTHTHTERVAPHLVSSVLSYKTPNTPVAWESERIKPQKNSPPRFTEIDRLHKGMKEKEKEGEEIPYIASYLYGWLPSEKWRYHQIFHPSLPFHVAFKGSSFVFRPIEMPPPVTGCKFFYLLFFHSLTLRQIHQTVG